MSLSEEGGALQKALDWLEEQYEATPLREKDIVRYHRIAFTADSSQAGKYRTNDVFARESDIPRPSWKRVTALMRQMDAKLREEQERLDSDKAADSHAVIKLAVDVYQRIGLVHPFRDGNGRVARLAMSHVTRRYGLGYVILPHLGESDSHWTALQEAHRGDDSALCSLAMKSLEKI